MVLSPIISLIPDQLNETHLKENTRNIPSSMCCSVTCSLTSVLAEQGTSQEFGAGCLLHLSHGRRNSGISLPQGFPYPSDRNTQDIQLTEDAFTNILQNSCLELFVEQERAKICNAI